MSRFALAALVALVMILLGDDFASAGDQSPTTTGTSNYDCDLERCYCNEWDLDDCADMIEKQCDRLDEDVRNSDIAERIRRFDWTPNSFLNCDQNTRVCTCPSPRGRTVPGRGRRTQRVGSGETATEAAGTAGGGDTARFDEADALFGRRTETVAARRGTPAEEPAKEENGQDEPTLGAVKSDVAPPRDKTTKPPQGTLEAPSDLELSDVGSNSLTLSWRDNATTEHGVYVERGTPTRQRSGIDYHWKQIFAVEERVTSRVEGTGTRSGRDDGLRPGQRYCYRLRAFRGKGEAKSDYSKVACATTR